MTKLLWLLALAAIGWRLVTGHWPWERFLAQLAARWREPGGQPRRSAEVIRARALLGVAEEASHAQVIEAHRRLIAMVHPDRGGTSEQVHEANAARDLLLASLADRRTE